MNDIGLVDSPQFRSTYEGEHSPSTCSSGWRLARKVFGVVVSIILSLVVFQVFDLREPEASALGPKELPRAGLIQPANILNDTLLASNQILPPFRSLADANLPFAPVVVSSHNELVLAKLPELGPTIFGKNAGRTSRGHLTFYTAEPALQARVEHLVGKARAPHVAVIALEPKTGRVLALNARSSSHSNLLNYSGLPAASLFKIATTAAMLEQTDLAPESKIAYRGGTYTLNKWNYKPSSRYDNRQMSVTEALGRSCNPVFGRIALNHLNPETLKLYAHKLGFAGRLKSDLNPEPSSARIQPEDYSLARTAAGFGEVLISPTHAASLMAGLANDGRVMRPYLIDEIFANDGRILHRSKPELLHQSVEPQTAQTLLSMLESTVTIGTSRRSFQRGQRAALNGVRVAAKTGTLRGKSPAGVNNWFVAAAPIEAPKIALAVVVVDPRGISTKASDLGRDVLASFFESL